MVEQIRSPYDHNTPSPCEELLGLVHGLNKTDIPHQIGIEALKTWMVKHLSDSELRRLDKRDPIFNFNVDADTDSNEEATLFFVEWATRVKNGEFLVPLEGMRYKPRIKLATQV